MRKAEMPGVGFGLDFSVTMGVARSAMMGSADVHGWGGWASTKFWIDPQERPIGILTLQYIPSDAYPTGEDFRTLVYQALID